MVDRRRTLLAFLFFAALVTACGSHDVGKGSRPNSAASTPRHSAHARIELVESAPVETTLDHPHIPNASLVWLEMIERATKSLDFAEFYASEADPTQRDQSLLSPIIDAILRAAKRGVRVRFLADASFAAKYPETLAQFEGGGALVRRFDVAARMGGVLHAKYFVVDEQESFLGSQNFDWRSLSHIQEVGVRVVSPAIARALLDVFDGDWALAADDGASTHAPSSERRAGAELPRTQSGEVLALVASPKGWLPDERSWDLPHLVSMLDRAKHAVAVQLLSYKRTSRDGEAFTTLDDALRRAAARGVRVRLLVSEWGAKAGSEARRAIDELALVPNVEVRVLVVPPWSGGDIPFARVAHAKYLVVDEAHAWIGTSNWEGDYFTRSRNVGLVVDGGALPKTLERFFDSGWTSDYASRLR